MNTIKKNDLKRALETVKPALASKEIIEQTTSFAFVNDKVVTYNDEICISYPIGDVGIKGAVKAEELYKFLGKVKEEEVTITQEKDEIVLKAGRAKVGFAIQTEINLPLEEELSETGDWKKLPKNFLKAIEFAIPCTSNDMSNPKLVCVNLDEKGVVEATDNFRVVQFKLSKKLPFSSTLVPAASLREVIKLAPTEVAQGKGWLHFKNVEDTQISCRVFSDTFVDISGIIKKVKSKGIEFVFPDNVLEILDKAEVFTKGKTVHDESVDVAFDGKALSIESQSEVAWFKERVPVKSKSTNFGFKITPYLLKDILRETTTCTILEHLLKFEKEEEWIYITSLREGVK